MTTTSDVRLGSPPAAARPLKVRLAFFAAVTVLAASNVVSNRLWPEGYVLWNLAMTGVLLLGARAAVGLSWEDLGLHRPRLRRGLLVGGAVAAAVAVVYTIALSLPSTRGAFLDERAAGPLALALFAALIRIPLGTAVLEETAFRGVLPALVGGGWWRATLVSSGLFGLWHILPSIGMGTANAAYGAAFGGWGVTAEVAVAVLFTFGAGIWLCALRRWSGHLAAPVLAHVATNSFGVLIAWWMITHASGA